MNWEVAKTWLISLFVLLDVALGWQLYSSHQLSSGYVESQADLLANTKTMLADHGLTLATDAPTEQPELSSFQASIAAVSLKNLASVSFPHATQIRVSTANDKVRTNFGTLMRTPGGSWNVHYTQPPNISSSASVLTYAYQGSLYSLDAVTSTNRHAMYMQTVNHYPVFDVEIYTTQAQDHLMGFTQTAITHVKTTSSPKPVISSLDALDSLANAVDKTDSTGDNKILKVDLGYARKVPLYQTGNAKNYWFPVWRIVTGAQTYYVNAFTGEVEIVP